MPPSAVLPAAFFLSGAAGLIFQIVWVYRCGLVFGSSVAAVTVVLSGFMAGLAAGNAGAAVYGPLVASPLRVYALLELIVAVTGVLVTVALPHLTLVLVPLAGALGGAGGLVDLARFVLAFVVLVVPATAMGATLPILVVALCGRGEPFAVALGRLYGWNTLGAVVGVVIGEVVLIGAVGITGSAGVAAVLNVGAAALALSRPAVARPLPLARAAAADGRHTGPPAAAGRERWAGAPGVWPLFAAAAMSGALLLALEVVWFRFLSMYVLATTLATSVMLAVVLSGIGIGGLVVARVASRREDAAEALPTVACLAGLSAVGSYVAFQTITTGTQVGDWRHVLWLASALTLPVSCLSGALFTLLGDAIHRRMSGVARSAGWLTLANTLGAIAGPPAAAYGLLPQAGMERSLFVLALGYGAVALLTAWAASGGRVARGIWRRRPRLRLAAPLALGLAVAAFPFGAMDSRYFLRAAAAYGDDGSTIVATREGPSETIFVMQQRWLGQPVYSRLVTNGFSMSGTAIAGQRYMRAFVYYPMLLHAGPLRRVLVVCYGVGVTVGAATHIPSVESIDVAEISKDVVAMSDAIYPAGARPLDDPRVRLHLEDGRFFLQTTEERFDLITGEPPPPRTPGTVNIYTREYFQLVHDRLAEGGLATYWVPVARPRPGTDVNTIIRAFCDVFSDCSLWNATPFDFMLVGSRGATGPRAGAEWAAPWLTPGLEARLREVGFERPEQIGATFLGDAPYLRTLTTGAPPLTDDFPQRLHPVDGRPSLSDPDDAPEAAATRMYRQVVDPERARAAFLTSPWIRSFWPPPLLERTAAYFGTQAAINRVYWDGGRPLAHIDDLDAVLATTTLRTLPLWILGSDEVKQRIAEAAPPTGAAAAEPGAIEYARGLRALSGRDYAGAARWLEVAGQRGMRAANVPALRAYALARSGDLEAARALATGAPATTADERHFWQWFRDRVP